MKNVLQKLERSNFISNIHGNALWADTVSYVDLIKKHPDIVRMTKLYGQDKDLIGDLRIKFSLMTSGFHQYLYALSDAKTESIMLSCSLPDGSMLIAFKEAEDIINVTKYFFQAYGSVPLHRSVIDLDFKNKVHILLYNLKFAFPGISMN